MAVTYVCDSEELGMFVRMQRKQKGLTQAELAKKAGVGLRFLSELERGKPTCQLAPTMRVIAALGLKVNLTPLRQWEHLDIPLPSASARA